MSLAQHKLYKPLLVLLAVGMLSGVSRIQTQINSERESMGLTHLQPLENAPPLLAFTTVALGGFRGLIANALWIRASELQDKDKYFEMVQLSDWITKLQPHMTQVWLHQAWNMAYNISVKFPSPEDRWRWVRRGIELLRDQALKYNPDEPGIYRDLGWLYQHKIGANMDDANLYYKGQWIREMQSVLGGNGLPNYDQLLNPGTAEETNRVGLLREVYKLDPKFMKSVDEKYGPLDWRLPEAHAIYWASLGLQRSKDTNLIILRRMVYQCMQASFIRGALVADRATGKYVMGPNLAIVPHANESYEEMLKLDKEMHDDISNAHKHFLEYLPYFFYTNNRRTLAQQWLDTLRKRYPGSAPDKQSVDDYSMAYVNELAGETDRDKVTMILDGLIESSYLAMINDEDDRAVNYNRLADGLWNRYEKSIRGPNGEQRVGLDPIRTLKLSVLDRLLDPRGGIRPQAAAILRTKLGLSGTNVPSVFNSSPTNSVGVTATNTPPAAAQTPPKKK